MPVPSWPFSLPCLSWTIVVFEPLDCKVKGITFKCLVLASRPSMISSCLLLLLQGTWAPAAHRSPTRQQRSFLLLCLVLRSLGCPSNQHPFTPYFMPLLQSTSPSWSLLLERLPPCRTHFSSHECNLHIF